MAPLGTLFDVTAGAIRPPQTLAAHVNAPGALRSQPVVRAPSAPGGKSAWGLIVGLQTVEHLNKLLELKEAVGVALLVLGNGNWKIENM